MPADLSTERRTIGELLRTRAAETPDQPFLLTREESIGFGELDLRSNALARGLAERGVGAGSRVALFMDNSPEFLLACLALGKLGAVGVPLNTAARGTLLAYFIEDAGCSLAVVDSAYVPTVAAAAPRLPLVVHGASTSGPDPGAWPSVAELIAAGESRRETPPAASPSFVDPWLIMYTSGTTGPSKGVVCPHAHPLGVARDVAREFGLESDDRLYACLPLFHANALWYSVLTALFAGASVAVAERFSASRFWRDVEYFGATEFNAIMAVATILEKLEPTPEEARNQVRLAFVVPLPVRRLELEERWGLRFACNYSMTELTPAAVLRPGEGRDRPGTSGTAVDHVELRIVDEDDLPVPPGEVGEIAIRPREPWSIFSSYHGKPEATVEAFRNLWFHTGDRGYLDDDGFFYFADRATDSLRRRGENISAQEIELVLEADPRIAEAAVIGVPSDLGEDDVAVYVVAAGEGLGEADVIEIARMNLAPYMVPRYVGFLEAIPKTGTHKKEKYKLRDLIEESGLGALWDRDRRAAAPTTGDGVG